VSTLPLRSAEPGGFTLIGRHADVDVYHGEIGRAVELAAVGTIDGKPEDVLGALLSQTDPRTIAIIAERWLGTMAQGGDFALSVRWTIQGAVGMRFGITDNRGAVTRARNWVDQIVGSWGLEPLGDGETSRAIYHARIELASPPPRWTVRSGALAELPAMIEQVRSIIRSR
jgi:hypothetical protein